MLFSKDKYLFANTLIMPYVDIAIKKRPQIPVLSEKQKIDLFEEIVNEAIDSIEEDCEWNVDYKEALNNEFGEMICPHCGAGISGIGYAVCKYCDSLVEMPA